MHFHIMYATIIYSYACTSHNPQRRFLAFDINYPSYLVSRIKESVRFFRGCKNAAFSSIARLAPTSSQRIGSRVVVCGLSHTCLSAGSRVVALGLSYTCLSDGGRVVVFGLSYTF